MDSEPLICAICGDLASGIHFGVNSCRACAAFYRRSAVANRKYVCRFNGNCEIGKDIRCCCRACRWVKCTKLGMRADAVQHHRDRIGPRKKNSNEDQSEIEAEDSGQLGAERSTLSHGSSSSTQSPSNPVAEPFRPNPMHVEQDGRSFTLLTSYSDQPQASSSFSMYTQINEPIPPNTQPNVQAETPLINEMLRGYRKFVALQRTARNLTENTNFNKLFDDQVDIVEGNYSDDISSIRSSLSLVSELINEHFHPLENFNTSLKWLMLRQFFCQFLIISRSYLSSKYFPELDDPRFMLTYNHFGSLEALERVFAVENCKVEPARMAEIFKPTMQRVNSMITNPMRKLKLSEEELCGLMGLLFWNDTLSNLEAQEAQTVVNTQRKIVAELYSVCRTQAGSNLDASIRFGILVNIVPLTNRFANEMAGNFSLANMSNSFSGTGLFPLDISLPSFPSRHFPPGRFLPEY